MQKLSLYIISFITLFLFGCENSSLSFDDRESQEVSIRVISKQFARSSVSGDNSTDTEEVIHNLSLFFTEPSSENITHRFIYTHFSMDGLYELITLSLDPEDIREKDIYVIANYDDAYELNAASTVKDLQSLITPWVNKDNNLSPEKGFCMFGSLSDFNFDAGPTASATIGLVRTCAKIKVKVSFSAYSGLNLENNLFIENAACYTYVVKNTTTLLSSDDYFTFANPIPLIADDEGNYIGYAYVYEATEAPILHIYTHFDDTTKQQELSVELPPPDRNYFYDLSIELDENVTRTASDVSLDNYMLTTSLLIYNEKGEPVDSY